ncbi:hypothetical protein ZIOFF_051360 [Zingiber officinale]|uniref:Ferredoxin thioredoxin reductase alpha chain domain-containing protein n=1 Tax=Zingiber officinale TaxID=94328 RepID=A0A8J5FLT6_ZINOF|nr:hypothetical protein ZIOFF_051360 [Zingiber officinale]
MPSPATAAAAALSPSLFLQSLPSAATIAPLSRPSLFRPCPTAIILPFRARLRVTCHTVLSADVSSSAEIEEEEQLAAAKIGKRVRVIVPLKVYHVQKAPGLDLNGLEGVIKQYVGVWKGKRISGNLPFKIEFQIEASSDDNVGFMIDMLKECVLSHKSIIFVLDEFDLFAQGKQRLLYSLLDAMQTMTSQAVVIGVSCRLICIYLVEVSMQIAVFEAG